MINSLEDYFYKNKGHQIYKWTNYFEFYEKHLNQFIDCPITIVEFGVMHGGSLQMWKSYFGKRARVIGVDFNPRCKELEEKQIEIIIGDQEEKAFLRKLKKDIGPIDIIVDDGGHTMKQQMTTFEAMWPALRDGGVYIVEDVLTSYWPMYGGKYKKEGTFISFTKSLVDQMNAWFANPIGETGLKIDAYTKSIKAIHFYTSLVIIEKAKMTQPHVEKHGQPTDIKFNYLGNITDG